MWRERGVRDDLDPARACCVGRSVVRVVCWLFGVESGDVGGGALDTCTDEGVVGDGARTSMNMVEKLVYN